MNAERQIWVNRLRSVAMATLGKQPLLPQPGTFIDEQRKRLAVDEGLFASLRSDTRWGVGATQAREGEVRLWCGAPVDAVVLPCDATYAAGGRGLLGDWNDQPADTPQVATAVWTDRELCALHALWTRARSADPADRARWARRGHQACRWLLANKRDSVEVALPWSAHVWVLVSESEPREWGSGLGTEARVYAENLLHGCLKGRERPGGGRRAAWILWHAARELESW
ncbi:MAG: hypothetical protein Q8L55_06845 [Phycisphaerales bacterium]|nr:hypothetical protein [Phycisphaerales bacterium]